jgi:hypothetical protein
MLIRQELKTVDEKLKRHRDRFADFQMERFRLTCRTCGGFQETCTCTDEQSGAAQGKEKTE